MGQKTIDKAPATKLLFDEASSILGYDLLKLCLNGPKDLLDRTEHCQIAIVIASLGIIYELKCATWLPETREPEKKTRESRRRAGQI